MTSSSASSNVVLASSSSVSNSVVVSSSASVVEIASISSSGILELRCASCDDDMKSSLAGSTVADTSPSSSGASAVASSSTGSPVTVPALSSSDSEPTSSVPVGPVGVVVDVSLPEDKPKLPNAGILAWAICCAASCVACSVSGALPRAAS